MSTRIDKVNELLKREIAAIIARDFEFSDVLVTVNSVATTPDLRQANVFIGFVGNPIGQRHATESLHKRRGHIQQRLGSRITMRYTPRITFCTDDSIERGVDMLNLLDEVDKLPTAPPAEEGEE